MKTSFASFPSAPPMRSGKSRPAAWLLAAAIIGAGWFGGPMALAHGRADFNPDQIIIKPRPGVDMAALNRALGVHTRRAFPKIGNLAVVEVPPGATADELISAYQQLGVVNYAEHDFYLHPLKAHGPKNPGPPPPPGPTGPDDPYYVAGDQWSLRNLGQDGGLPGADIHAWEAWQYATSAAGVIVAVVDTGIRYTHQDLAANMWVNPADGSHGINVVNNGRAENDPWDDYGHGTHCAGIIGAVSDNGVGIAGICWQVQLMACKFLDTNGNGTVSGAIACLDYARANGAKVVNASWGSFTFTSQALHDAIASLRDADIIFVAAAGNSSANNDVTPLYPASYWDLDNVVSVAATDDRDQLTSWSDYGATNVDLAAPGMDIYSCWDRADNDYTQDRGTSMACAHVTGACALLRASFPGEDHRQIIQRLLNGTDPLPGLKGKCKSGGRLDLFKALENPLTSSRLPGRTGQASARLTPNRRAPEPFIEPFLFHPIQPASFYAYARCQDTLPNHFEFN